MLRVSRRRGCFRGDDLAAGAFTTDDFPVADFVVDGTGVVLRE
jgi:hypothetical protein